MNKGPIRVAHIVGKMVGGGVEAFIMNYYRNIDRTKIQFDFIIDSDSTVVPKEEIEKLGGRIIFIPPYQKIIKYIISLYKILKQNKYEIVHSHINTLSVIPLFVANLNRIPIRIAHSHATTNKKEWKRNLIKSFLRPFSKVFATDYFSCSEYAGRWLFGNRAYENGDVIVLNNAIDVDKFKFNIKTREKIRKKLGIADDEFVVGHVGRFVKTKNHEFLLRLTKKMIDDGDTKIKLLLIGDGPLLEKIHNEIKELKIETNVLSVGIKENVQDYLQAMDVFVLPSLYEGFGMSLLEAQVSGLFCVASNYVTQEVNVLNMVEFISLDDIDMWKKKIESYRNDKESRFVNLDKINNFDIIKEAPKLEKIYYEKVRK